MLDINAQALRQRRDQAVTDAWEPLLAAMEKDPALVLQRRQKMVADRVGQLIPGIPEMLHEATGRGLNFAVVMTVDPPVFYSPYVHSPAKTLDRERFDVECQVAEAVAFQLKDHPNLGFTRRLISDPGSPNSGFQLLVYLKG